MLVDSEDGHLQILERPDEIKFQSLRRMRKRGRNGQRRVVRVFFENFEMFVHLGSALLVNYRRRIFQQLFPAKRLFIAYLEYQPRVYIHISNINGRNAYE